MNRPPADEPPGYCAEMGFVKSRPENNEYYIEHWKGDPWYELIRRTHAELEALIPGYNIAQVKAKFGGMRYYIDIPDDTPQDVKEQAWKITSRAEEESFRL